MNANSKTLGENIDQMNNTAKDKMNDMRNQAEGIERRIASRLSGQGPGGELADRRETGFGPGLFAQRAAVILVVGQIIAAPAPGIEQPDPLPRRRIEQAAGHGKALRAAHDRLAGVGKERCAVRQQTHKSLVFIAKIGVCGSCAAIRVSSRSSSVSAMMIPAWAGRMKPTATM